MARYQVKKKTNQHICRLRATAWKKVRSVLRWKLMWGRISLLRWDNAFSEHEFLLLPARGFWELLHSLNLFYFIYFIFIFLITTNPIKILLKQILASLKMGIFKNNLHHSLNDLRQGKLTQFKPSDNLVKLLLNPIKTNCTFLENGCRRSWKCSRLWIFLKISSFIRCRFTFSR